MFLMQLAASLRGVISRSCLFRQKTTGIGSQGLAGRELQRAARMPRGAADGEGPAKVESRRLCGMPGQSPLCMFQRKCGQVRHLLKHEKSRFSQSPAPPASPPIGHLQGSQRGLGGFQWAYAIKAAKTVALRVSSSAFGHRLCAVGFNFAPAAGCSMAGGQRPCAAGADGQAAPSPQGWLRAAARAAGAVAGWPCLQARVHCTRQLRIE